MDTQHSDSPSCPKDFTQTWKNTATSLLQSCDIKGMHLILINYISIIYYINLTTFKLY